MNSDILIFDDPVLSHKNVIWYQRGLYVLVALGVLRITRGHKIFLYVDPYKFEKSISFSITKKVNLVGKNLVTQLVYRKQNHFPLIEFKYDVC